MTKDKLRDYVSGKSGQTEEARNPILGTPSIEIPGVPINSNIQTMLFVGLGWLFSLVAAKYGLDSTQLEETVIRYDEQINTQITNAVANYDKYRAVIIGIILVVINGGNLWAAGRAVKSNAEIADAQSRAIVSRNLAIESANMMRTKELEYNLERARLHNAGYTEVGASSSQQAPVDSLPQMTFPSPDELPGQSFEQ